MKKESFILYANQYAASSGLLTGSWAPCSAPSTGGSTAMR